VSAIGLPMNGHVAEHFAPDGLCQCPCDQCTTRTAKFCVCLDCPCEEQGEHAGMAAVWPDDYVVVAEFPASPGWTATTFEIRRSAVAGQ
jgi:hypothetical protein